MKTLQPSASRTALLLACPRPFELEARPDEAGEAARYGSAFHRVLARCLASPTKSPLEKNVARYENEVAAAARSYDVDRAGHELAGHVKSSVKYLRNWLTREKLSVAEIETAKAFLPQRDGRWGRRPIPSHDQDHRYDVVEGELPGTVDLIARSTDRRREVVIDHKTGSGSEDTFAQPAKIPQMRTLGLAGPTGMVREVELGIFHADRRGLPVIYTEEYEPQAQRAHTIELHAAMNLVGHGFLRAGAHCNHCPAKVGCPAHTAELLSDGTTALMASAQGTLGEPLQPEKFGLLAPTSSALSLEDRAGRLYEALKAVDKIREAAYAEIKRLVKEGKVIETKKGVLALREDAFETLSKKSVVEALGKLAGEKELARLRKKGAMREATREVLVADKEGR